MRIYTILILLLTLFECRKVSESQQCTHAVQNSYVEPENNCMYKKQLSEDKTPTRQEVRLHNSMTSTQKDECSHRVNIID